MKLMMKGYTGAVPFINNKAEGKIEGENYGFSSFS